MELIVITVSNLPKNYWCNDLLSELLWFSLPSWKLFKHWENTLCIHEELGFFSFFTYIKSHVQRQNLCRVSLGNLSIVFVFSLQTEQKATGYHLIFKFPLCVSVWVCVSVCMWVYEGVVNVVWMSTGVWVCMYVCLSVCLSKLVCKCVWVYECAMSVCVRETVWVCVYHMCTASHKD